MDAYRALPLSGITHDDGTTLFVVLIDAHLEYVVAGIDTKLLVNLVFDWKAMGVPSKTPAGRKRIRGGQERKIEKEVCGLHSAVRVEYEQWMT